VPAEQCSSSSNKERRHWVSSPHSQQPGPRLCGLMAGYALDARSEGQVDVPGAEVDLPRGGEAEERSGGTAGRRRVKAWVWVWVWVCLESSLIA
jgi:hypothetical protein